MAIRNNTFILKRSNVVNKIPALSGLTLGELALNTADAKLYTLYTGGLTGATEVREIGWNRLSVSGGTLYGNLNVLGSVSATTFYGSGANLTNIPDTFVTGFTFSSNTLTILQNQGKTPLTASITTIDLSNVFSAVTFNIGTTGSISATTFYGNGSNLTGIPDNFVTGGTFTNNTLTLNRQNGSVTVTGITDTFVTGFTYSNNNLTINQNQGQSPLFVNISVMTGLTINGNLTVTGNTSLRALTGTSALFSGSGQNILTVIGSGSSTTPPIFTVQGSQGELFSVTDSLTGSLFSVNDISGLPILEVFSDNTILMGSYLAPSLNTTIRTTANTGSTTIYSIPISAYTGAFFEYTVNDGTNLRAGSIMSIWSGNTVNYTETSTTDIGNTNPITFNMISSSGFASLRTSATTNSWTVKTIVRSI